MRVHYIKQAEIAVPVIESKFQAFMQNLDSKDLPKEGKSISGSNLLESSKKKLKAASSATMCATQGNKEEGYVYVPILTLLNINRLIKQGRDGMVKYIRDLENG